MFQVVAFNNTATPADADTTVALDPVGAVADPQVHVEGDNIYVPAETLELIGFWGFTGSLTATETAVAAQIRLEAPSMGVYKDISKFQKPAAAAADDEEPDAPTPLNLWLANPMILTAGEGLQMKVRETVAGDDRQATGLVWFGNGNYMNPYLGIPDRSMLEVRFTAAVAAAAYEWKNGAITFEQSLPVGQYAIMGMHVISDSGIAARLVIGGQGARPGCLAYDDIEDISNEVFRKGHLGVWGVFHTHAPPTLDMLCRTTDTSQEGWLDLIKIR